MNEKGVKELVHYAVDRVSPFALTQYSDVNSYEKIAEYPLARLAITEQGIKAMWAWINVRVYEYQAMPVSNERAFECETVKDIFEAIVEASLKRRASRITRVVKTNPGSLLSKMKRSPSKTNI